MGCDIHIILEKKHEDTWVGIREMGYLPGQAIRAGFKDEAAQGFIKFKLKERDYNFFYGLAGVRGGDDPPREANGFPDDASSLSNLILGGDSDLHSHGFITVTELIPIIAARKYESSQLAETLDDPTATEVAAKLENKVSPVVIVRDWIDEDIQSGDYDNYRIVFAFDN